MSLVIKTKRKASEFLLKREAKNRHRQVHSINFSKASNIGILFDASDKKDFETVKAYIKKLKDDGKKIQALGFYNYKETPVMMNSKLEYDFFTLREINWHFKPTSSFVNKYLDINFDILINLCTKTVLPLMYVLALSKAKFKVGMYREKYISYYDVLVHHNHEKGLPTFIQNLEKYLVNIH
jgi:hypothetical protein